MSAFSEFVITYWHFTVPVTLIVGSFLAGRYA